MNTFYVVCIEKKKNVIVFQVSPSTQARYERMLEDYLGDLQLVSPIPRTLEQAEAFRQIVAHSLEWEVRRISQAICIRGGIVIKITYDLFATYEHPLTKSRISAIHLQPLEGICEEFFKYSEDALSALALREN